MKINDGQSKFIVINQQANSLYSLIADGQYRKTSLGRDTWKSLIGSEASLQYNCNKEGFNAYGKYLDHSKVRIGILGNNENDCDLCDSRIGFGTGGNMITTTRVETKLRTRVIITTSTSRPWDTSWCSDKKPPRKKNC